MSLETLCIYWGRCSDGDRDECKDNYEDCPKYDEYLKEEMKNERFKN